MRLWHLFATIAMLASISAISPRVAASAAAKALAPHKAVYDLSLDNRRGANNIAAARGRLVFDFAGSACDGYTLNIRLVTHVTHRTGNAIVTDLRSSTWEQGDGRQFRFNSTEYQDEKLNESARGTAVRNKEKQGVTVKLTGPEEEKLSYDGEILFPTQHSLAILKAARSGQRLLQALVFDGSEQGKKLYRTTTFIGNRKPAGEGKRGQVAVENTEILDRQDSWPVTISYFDGAADSAETPAYELSFHIYENGVSRYITIDYGDFAIKGKLTMLEFSNPPECE